MRILVCDHHVVFAESLALLFEARGKRVVAVTHDVDRAVAVLRHGIVDVCVLGVQFGTESAVHRLAEVCAADPGTRVVVLSGQVDGGLLAGAAAAGVRGVADKRQPVADIVDLLDRVYAGERMLSVAVATADHHGRLPRQRPANDAQRLAAFLTPRERQVLSALVCGEDTNKVARSLGIAATTARCHIQSVLTKMGAHSRLEVATTAVRSGMVSPETGEWLIPVG